MKLAILKHLAIAVVLAFGAMSITAQTPEASAPKERSARPHFDLFRELGLSKEQIKKIRDLRISGRDAVSAAQKQLREANKALDAAIYADVLDEQLIELRIIERNQAQAAVGRLRTMSELDLRKILTPEQLLKFREIREVYEKRQQEIKEMRSERKEDRRKSRSKP